VGQVGTGAASGLSAPPSINYEDLGLVLKVTPSVHDQDEVTLDIDTEFKVLGTTDANGNPSISTRKYTGKVRMRMDESAIVAGMLGTTDGTTVNGIFGISSIPILGRLLRTNNINKSSDQVLIVLRPRLLNVPPWEFGSAPIWLGTETKPLTLF
jgi:general secretion pathway protein D